MKRFTIVFLPLLMAVGCNMAEMGVRLAPKEVQKQSAALVVENAATLDATLSRLDMPDIVRDRIASVMVELKMAAANTQTYFGLPAKPVLSGAADNLRMLKAAELVSPLRPTLEETANAGIDSLERGVTTGFELADRLLILAGGIAGAWGVGKVRRRVTASREALAGYKERAELTTAALRQVTRGIEDLPDPTREVVKAAQKNRQKGATPDIVRDARRVS